MPSFDAVDSGDPSKTFDSLYGYSVDTGRAAPPAPAKAAPAPAKEEPAPAKEDSPPPPPPPAKAAPVVKEDTPAPAPAPAKAAPAPAKEEEAPPAPGAKAPPAPLSPGCCAGEGFDESNPSGAHWVSVVWLASVVCTMNLCASNPCTHCPPTHPLPPCNTPATHTHSSTQAVALVQALVRVLARGQEVALGAAPPAAGSSWASCDSDIVTPGL